MSNIGLIQHAYNFVNGLTDDELYNKIIRSENIGWPLILSTHVYRWPPISGSTVHFRYSFSRNTARQVWSCFFPVRFLRSV